MHHMTANWSPLAQEQRRQLCYGVWGVVGSTGPWPQVVNMWEEDGFDGLAESFAHEFATPRMQDPALEKWWAAAADMRSGGTDRIVLPHPDTMTIEQVCAAGIRGEVYAHELVHVEPGAAMPFLDAAMTDAEQLRDRYGWQLVGAWRTAMRVDSECLLLWAIPTWGAWAAGEKAAAEDDRLLPTAAALVNDRQRILLVDAELSP